jgi:hypothetical protein
MPRNFASVEPADWTGKTEPAIQLKSSEGKIIMLSGFGGKPVFVGFWGGKAFHRTGIPLGVLIDANGQITFYKSGYGIAELRAAVAKLGPAFHSVAVASIGTTAPNSK